MSSDSAFNAEGERRISDACVVKVLDSREPYYMDGFAYLERHPTQTNTCFFRDHESQRDVMDMRPGSSGRNSCGRTGFLSDANVTQSVAPAVVNNKERCVVRFKTPTSAQVAEYEDNVRKESITLTAKYQGLEREHNVAKARLDTLKDRIEQRKGVLTHVENDNRNKRGAIARTNREVENLKDDTRQVARVIENLQNEIRVLQTVTLPGLEQAKLEERKKKDAAVRKANEIRGKLDELEGMRRDKANEKASVQSMMKSLEQQRPDLIREMNTAASEDELLRKHLQDLQGAPPLATGRWLADSWMGDGRTIRETTERNVRDCAQLCADNPICRAATWRDSKCQQKETNGARVRAVNGAYVWQKT
jgi:hypothetical protein